MKKCPHCGTQVQGNTRFCKQCGFKLKSTDTSLTPLTKNNASLDTDTLPHRSGNRDAVAQSSTAPLESSNSDFAALPIGALLSSEETQYQVIKLLESDLHHNLYRVKPLQQIRHCQNPECSHQETEKSHCPECGTQTTEVAGPTYRLQETPDIEPIASLIKLHQRGLNHPTFLLYETFQQRLYETATRYYLLKPEPGPLLLNDLSLPQGVGQVLDWGQQLSEGLTYLHKHGIVWQTLEGEHIAIENTQARWLNFDIIEAQETTQYRQNVQDLTRLLFFLATGEQDYTPKHTLPEPIARFFEQVLGPDPTITSAINLTQAIKKSLAHYRRPTMINLISYAHTDVGQLRDHNEDSLMTLEQRWINEDQSHPIGLYAVADGMGGHSAGEVASRIVINILAQEMAHRLHQVQERNFEAPQSWLQATVAKANQAVFEQAQQTKTDMGTTVVIALVIANKVYISHVGDSRVYRLNAERIERLTTDHSLVERLVATGQITPEEAQHHPQRNVIYRTLGDKLEIDIDVNIYHLQVNDRLLLCSDGLNGMITDEEIWHIVTTSPSLSQACHNLIAAANQAGGDDNITTILVQLLEG